MRRPWPAVLCLLLVPRLVGADDLDEQRAFFEQGMAAFREGKVAEALGYWEPILGKLGDVKGYRLLYNVGIARELLGDTSAAADRYERFLGQIAARPAEQIPAEVQEFARDAGARLASMKARHARIRVIDERARPVLVRLDQGAPALIGPTFYVIPGVHQITTEPGSPGEQSHTVDVARGQLHELRIKAPLPAAAPPPVVSVVSVVVSVPAPAPPAPRPPFSPVWVGVAAALTVGSLALPLALRADSLDIKRVYEGSPGTTPQHRERLRGLYDEYDQSRSRYELSWLLPGALAVGTGVLGAVYLLAPREARKERTVALRVGASSRGLGLSIQGALP